LQQHPDNSIRKIHSEKGKGLAGAIIIHTTLLLLLIFIAFKVPPPPEFEEGIEVNFGTDETGFGDIEPAPSFAPAAVPAAASAPAPRTVTSVDEPLLTQDIEEAPEVRRVDPNAERIRQEQAAEAERIRLQNLEAERIRRAEEEAAREIERQRAEAEQRVRNALAGANTAAANSNSEGVAGGPGNQGSPTGSINSNVRGEGTGTGSSGISFDLAGRRAQGLPNPRYDCQEAGRVVVEIRVDREGRVTQANPGRPGSTSIVECLTRAARDAAMATRFDSNPNAPAVQVGTITYNFVLR